MEVSKENIKWSHDHRWRVDAKEHGSRGVQ
jgi:hypothetical protein